MSLTRWRKEVRLWWFYRRLNRWWGLRSRLTTDNILWCPTYQRPRSCLCPTCSDQRWSALIGKRIFLISSDQNQNSSFPSHFGWKATQQWPHSALLSADQHWSECSALNELISAECLKAEQNWTELSDAEQNWVLHEYCSCYSYYNKKVSAWTGIEPGPPDIT